jgi:hypothetical protein
VAEYIHNTGSLGHNIMHNLNPTQTDRSRQLPPTSGGGSMAKWTRALASVSLLIFEAISAQGQSHGLLPIGSVVVFGIGPSAHVNVISNHYVFYGDLVQVETATSSVNEMVETSYAYDEHGQLLSSVTIAKSQDGNTSRTTTNYLNLGPHQTQAIVIVEFGDGSAERQLGTSTTTSNDHGDAILQVDEFDDNGDGILDRRLASTWEYDYANQKMVFTQNQDWNGDGVFDTDSRFDYALDKSGRPLSWKGHVGDQSGQPGGLYASGTFTYDKFGDLLEDRFAILFPGAFGAGWWTRTTTRIYAHRGEVLRNAGRPAITP